jgi:hypothetical protein
MSKATRAGSRHSATGPNTLLTTELVAEMALYE